ncbi:MAG: heparinase II/III family protein, partial [Lachnospiraceae bacterium]|nr:heparinase II/III family protein [Lachnospiraceae bacterium]
EFAEAEVWRKYAVEIFTSKIDEQFSEDGYTREMSGAYHWIAMRNFFAFYQVAKNNGMEEIFPDVYKNAIYRAAWAEYYQQKPDYSLPVTNDSNVTTRHRMQLELLKEVIDEEIVDYRLSNGKEGKAPEHVSYFYPDAKLAVMRSDWSENAIYGSLDMGPWGINHMNEDQLNLEVSAYGRNLLVNSGRWRYTTSPGISWLSRAQYFKNTPSYNSLICDDMGQMPGDADGVMVINESFDYAKGTFASGYGKTSETQTVSKEFGSVANKEALAPDVTHTREVFFAKEEGFFIVRDTMESKEEHTYTQTWHMAEGSMEKCDMGYFSTFEDANFVMLQLNQPQMKYYCGNEEPFKGWNCPAYDHLVPAPEVDVYLSGSGTVVFETLLLPVKGRVNEENLPEFKKMLTNDGVVYQVTMNGKTMSILAGEQWKLI